MFFTLSARFGWTPTQIAELTLPQLNGYLRSLGKHPAPIVFLAAPS